MRNLSLNETLSVTGAGFAEDVALAANTAIAAGGLAIAGAAAGAVTAAAMVGPVFVMEMFAPMLPMATAISIALPVAGAIALPGLAASYAYYNYPEVKQAVDSYFG